jgi:hypothetical protein
MATSFRLQRCRDIWECFLGFHIWLIGAKLEYVACVRHVSWLVQGFTDGRAADEGSHTAV